MTTVWTSEDGPSIMAHGFKMAKKRNPVYLVPVVEEGIVRTNEGPLSAHIGDFIAYDPISGHVWPVAADYVNIHYEAF